MRKDAAGRIRSDDKLIKRPAVLTIMGGISTSADPELKGLKIASPPPVSFRT
jgi:hypothetical protein